MAATRLVLAPLGGIFVATSLLYTFRHTIAVRTHDTAVALNRIQLQLNDIDPDNWDKEGKQRVSREQLKPAYVAPVRPTVTEEIKARWNVSPPHSSKGPSHGETLLTTLSVGLNRNISLVRSARWRTPTTTSCFPTGLFRPRTW